MLRLRCRLAPKLPSSKEHFAWSKGGCVVQVHSSGPFEIKYVNPSDDPRQAKK